jgi:hypothetical protein
VNDDVVRLREWHSATIFRSSGVLAPGDMLDGRKDRAQQGRSATVSLHGLVFSKRVAQELE